MPAPQHVRVGLLEEDAVVRDVLTSLLSTAPGMRLTGSYHSVATAAAALDQGLECSLPNVLLIGLPFGESGGAQVIRIFRERWPKLMLIVLTRHEEEAYIIEALCAGADGYLLRTTYPQILLQTIREAMEGGAPMTPSITAKVIRLFRAEQRSSVHADALTPHEMRILRLLASGENYKTSAALLKVSVNTVSFHVRSIYSKLQVHSRAEAVATALRRGLVR